MSILRVYFGGHNGVWIDVRTFRFERIEGSAARYGVDGKRVLVHPFPLNASSRFRKMSHAQSLVIGIRLGTLRLHLRLQALCWQSRIFTLLIPLPSSRELRNYTVRLRHAPTFCIIPPTRTLACHRCLASGWYFPSHCC